MSLWPAEVKETRKRNETSDIPHFATQELSLRTFLRLGAGLLGSGRSSSYLWCFGAKPEGSLLKASLNDFQHVGASDQLALQIRREEKQTRGRLFLCPGNTVAIVATARHRRIGTGPGKGNRGRRGRGGGGECDLWDLRALLSLFQSPLYSSLCSDIC